LSDEVCADGHARQAVSLQDLDATPDVVRLSEGAVDLEVVAPAGELEAVEAPVGDSLCKYLERQIGPLSGEERHGSGHLISFRLGSDREGLAGRARPARAHRAQRLPARSPSGAAGRARGAPAGRAPV